MVTFVKGDILKSPAQVVTNPINCAGVMGKGLAAQFKKNYSEMFNDYKRRCASGDVRIGRPYIWENDSTQILLFPTKNSWREKSRLEDVEAGLKFLAANYVDLGITSLALPALGCGNGGLSWNDVRELIIKSLGSIPDLEVFVYEPAMKALDKADPESKVIPRSSIIEKAAAKPHA